MSASVSNKSYTILVIDENLDFLQEMQNNLTATGFLVGIASNSFSAFDKLKAGRPDLVITELKLPYLDGADQIKLMSLDDDLVSVPVIMVSRDAVSQERQAEYLQGIPALKGWFNKPVDFSELLQCIHATLADVLPNTDVQRVLEVMTKYGGREKVNHAPSQPLRVGPLTMYSRLVVLHDTQLRLTPTEYHVLAELCRQVGKPVGKGSLLTLIWGSEAHGSVRLLGQAISQLRRKIGARSPTPIIKTVRGVGYKITIPPQGPHT